MLKREQRKLELFKNRDLHFDQIDELNYIFFIKEHYEMGSLLQKSDYSEVRAATHIASGLKVAIKIIKKSYTADEAHLFPQL